MATTISPLPSGGPFGDDAAIWPEDTGSGMASFVRPLLESRKKKPKSIIKEAEGTQHPRNSKPKKFTKPSVGKNFAKEAGVKHKKRGPFGETYQPVQAGKNKGVRVAESNRFRESVSAEDLRGMVQRALRVKFPPPPPGSFSGYPGEVSSGSLYSSPYVKDIFPDDKMVVFDMNSVPWGADFTVNEHAGTAKLSNIRRVKVEYVDFADDSGDSKTEESSFGESVFGREAVEGGPGSGPRKGGLSGEKKPDFTIDADSLRSMRQKKEKGVDRRELTPENFKKKYGAEEAAFGHQSEGGPGSGPRFRMTTDRKDEIRKPRPSKSFDKAMAKVNRDLRRVDREIVRRKAFKKKYGRE